jgi:hypothetical protein
MAKNQKKQSPPPKKQRAPRRTAVPPEVSSARKYLAWQMRIMNPGMTYAAITTELNEIFPDYPLKSEHQAVEKMIKEAEKEYIETHKEKVDEVKAEAGATLDWVRKEAADAWKRSQDLLKIIKKKDDQTVEQILKAEYGNAAFLRRVTEAVEVKTKIFGALAPRKHELTGKDGAPLVPPTIDLKALGKYLSNDDLDKLQEAAEVIERAQRDHDAAVQKGD